MLVTPIMNDVLGDIGIASCRNGFEETSRLDLKPAAVFRHALRGHAGNHLRKVIEHACHLGVGLQYRSKQQTMTAAHVRNAADPVEVIGIENGACLEGGIGGHRLVEILGLVGAIGKEVEGMLAISLAHAVLAGAKTMEELLIGPYRPFVAGEGREIAD
jgi:hypothetical protein